MSIVSKLLGGDAFDFEKLTVADTIVGFTKATFTANLDSQAHLRAVVTVEGGMMRYRYDGGDPSTTTGHLLAHGDVLFIEGSANLSNFKAIRTGAQSGILSTSFERVF